MAAALLMAMLSGGALADAGGGVLLNVPLSVRQMGIGNVSVGGDDVLRGWSNPALLAGGGQPGQVAVNGGPGFNQTQSSFGGGGRWAGDRFAWGVLLSAHTISFQENDEFGDPAGPGISSSQVAGGLGLAARFGWLRLGVTGKGVSDSLAGNSATTGAADLGAVAQWTSLAIAAALRNVGPTLRAAAAGTMGAESLPTEMRFGGAYRFAAGRLLTAAEFVVSGPASSAGAGIEWWLHPKFGIRAGAAGLGGNQKLQVTGGLSGILGPLSLDYALLTHPLGMTHQASLSYGFDLPKSEPGDEAAASAPVVRRKPGEMLNVAVSNLEAQNVSSSDAAVIADLLRGELVRAGGMNVVEKANMDKILTEQGFQQTGCTAEGCAVKLGKILNVQRMAVGSFGKLVGNYFLNIRMIEVETGKVVYADQATGETVPDLQKSIVQLAKRLAKSLR